MAVDKHLLLLEDFDRSPGGPNSVTQVRNGNTYTGTPFNAANIAADIAQGPTGPAGAPGQGVPVGGQVGQGLVKTGTADYATGWQDIGNATSINLDTAEATWAINPDDYRPNTTVNQLRKYRLGPNVVAGTIPTGWPNDRSYILQVRIAQVGTSATVPWIIYQRLEDEAGARLAYRVGTVASANIVNTPSWTQWEAVAGSGGGGTTNLTAQEPIEINNNVISLNASGRDPYQFFFQSKDLVAPALPGGSQRIVTTGDGLVLQFIPKFTPPPASGTTVSNRNFATQPEGFANLTLAAGNYARLEVALRTTHFFNDVNSNIPNLVTEDRVESVDVITGVNSISLSDFSSNVVITPSSTGGSLVGQAVPITVEIVLKALTSQGVRTEAVLTGLDYNKCGITFFQLADKIGTKGDKGDKGDPGTDGADGSTTFVGLTDTPNTISAGQYLRGNVSGTGLEYATISGGGNVPDNRLLPSTGGAAGRYVVDVFSNGQITPQWRDRIIPWSGAATGTHGNVNGFQIGDLLRYPNTGQNQNIYVVESAIAPGTTFASLATNAVRRLTGRGTNTLSFDNATRTFTLTRDDGTTVTTVVPGGSGGGTTYTAGDGIDISSSDVISVDSTTRDAITANTAKRSFPADDEAKLDGIAVGATVGATTAQQAAITANTAKRSYPQSDQTKLAGIATGATVGATAAQEARIALNDAKISASGDDHTGQPTFASGTLTIPRRTGNAYTVTIPTGSGGGNNIRDTLFNTATTIPNAGGQSGWPTGTNLSLQTGKTFANWDVIFVELEIDSGVSLGGGGVNRFSLTIDGATFRATTSSTRMVQRGSNETTAGYNLGIYNNPNTGETADTSSRFNVAGLGGANARIISIVGAQYRGQTGATGPQGAQGATGPQGNPGTPGTPGAPGADGQDGAAATIAVGTTTTSNPGTNATVTNSGTASQAVFDFAIPRGATGAQGAQGNPGTPGQAGAAATIAVGTTTTGNPGTSASVTNSGNSNQATFDFVIPRGADGTNGTDGQDGAAATVTVGTVTTGAPGTNATVTNTGTTAAAVLNFTIPQGQTGAAGTGPPPDNSVGKDQIQFDAGVSEGAGRAIVLGAANALSTAVIPPAVATNRLIPSGGTAGQVLKKDTGTDYDVSWQADTGGSATELEFASGSQADRTYPSTDGISYYGVTADLPTGVTAGYLRAVRASTNIAQHLQAVLGTNAGKIYSRISTNTGNTWTTWEEIGEGTGITPEQAAAIVANTAKVGITPEQASAIELNTAKRGLYPTSATPVGVWRGVSGNPGDSTTISSGTAQFDGVSSIYLSRTDANGNAISTAQLPAVGAAINFAGISSTVSAISQNSNRIKLDIAGDTQPIAAQGNHYYLYNVADPNHTSYGIHTKGALEGDGAPSMEVDVRDGGITTAKIGDSQVTDAKIAGVSGTKITNASVSSAKLDLASGDTITAGQAVVYRANGEFGSAPLGQGGGGTPADDSVGRDQLDFASGTVETNGRLVALTATGELTTVTASAQPTSTFGHDTLITPTAVTSKLSHTQNLDTNKVLTGHDAFLISFRYTHNITLSGHTFQSHNIWSKVYDGNDFRASAGGRQYFEEVFLEGQSTAHNVVFIVARNSDTSITISFTDTTATSASAATIDQFELVGIRYGGAASANATSINGLPVPAFPSS